MIVLHAKFSMELVELITEKDPTQPLKEIVNVSLIVNQIPKQLLNNKMRMISLRAILKKSNG